MDAKNFDGHTMNVNMVFTVEDRILVENLYKCKGFGAKKLVKEFPGKGWNVRSLNRLLKKLRDSSDVRPWPWPEATKCRPWPWPWP